MVSHNLAVKAGSVLCTAHLEKRINKIIIKKKRNQLPNTTAILTEYPGVVEQRSKFAPCTVEVNKFLIFYGDGFYHFKCNF